MASTLTRIMIGVGITVGTMFVVVGLLLIVAGIVDLEVPTWIGIATLYAGIHLELLAEIALFLWQDRQPPPA